MEELKRCPFCGATAPTVHISRERDEPKMIWQYQVVCNYNLGGCGASGCFDEEPNVAIESWNRRVNDASD